MRFDGLNMCCYPERSGHSVYNKGGVRLKNTSVHSHFHLHQLLFMNFLFVFTGIYFTQRFYNLMFIGPCIIVVVEE